MPPKKTKLDIIPSAEAGMTKQQREEAELQTLKDMAATLFASTHQAKGAKLAKTKKAIAQRQKMDETLQQRHKLAEEAFEVAHSRFLLGSVYFNEHVKLTEGITWHRVADGSNKWIKFGQFEPRHIKPIVHLLTISLSEPYNAFTYEYFLSGWPDLGIVIFGTESATKPDEAFEGEIIGTAVSKVARKAPGKPLRGYIAMLAVAESFRGFRLGQKLIRATVDLMRQKKVEEVALETPTTNIRALNLYLGLGFVKHKYLTRYYLDGQDAVRLKLWLTDAAEAPDMSSEQRQLYADFQRTLAQLRSIEAQLGFGEKGDINQVE